MEEKVECHDFIARLVKVEMKKKAHGSRPVGDILRAIEVLYFRKKADSVTF